MTSNFQELVFDPQVIRRFDVNGPRYTSYPTADRFVEAFGSEAYSNWLGRRTVGGSGRPLSLYVHIPFCNTICYYCACNKIITKDHGRSAKYIKYLGKEIAMQTAALDGNSDVIQLHWGGGTPTFLSHDEMKRLMELINTHFNLLPNGEYSIEVDPRKVDRATVKLLAELGFNRMSVGVQDFEPSVQKAVNRIQSLDETKLVIDSAREFGFKGISVDLIYGLPKQNVISFNHTLDEVLKLSPDRLSIYNYAHLPALAKPQRRIVEAELPTADAKLQILQLAIRRLTDAGYVFIGMDHFAKPDDELAVAQRQGRLHRNFQGYSTHAEADLLAFGVSAIGKVGPTYCQNYRTLDEYYDALDRSELPVMRGLELTADDLLRRSIIQALMCHFELSIESVEIAHLIDFKSYFEAELAALREMEAAGLLSIDSQWITVQPKGRMLVRVIAMAFDRYLRTDRERARYSKVI
ncbi:MAG: oxygen-independent coproporphyrinogen III oxidase [Gammaproteobacteria bacterium]|nr:oxygen-independent coproporphyrinogen III oxidase [Gammaproteobacteria bacterium]MBU1647159.1 oxygen-independent coproporphyrinogen III oxidase [Gammaproteobacteria bacterium]MBU1972671.1 oxygen-independent coproporphyrinogen III oxidase [Gammaproteobacteria bacterium]